MAETICIDTNLLIDHRRTAQKAQSKLFELASKYELVTTSISVFELWRGDNSDEGLFWEELFRLIPILNFDAEAARIAGADFLYLRKQGMLIEVEDVLIAAVAKRHSIRLATANYKHFSRVPGLQLIPL